MESDDQRMCVHGHRRRSAVFLVYDSKKPCVWPSDVTFVSEQERDDQIDSKWRRDGIAAAAATERCERHTNNLFAIAE